MNTRIIIVDNYLSCVVLLESIVTVYCLHFYIRLVSNCWKLLLCLNILKLLFTN